MTRKRKRIKSSGGDSSTSSDSNVVVNVGDEVNERVTSPKPESDAGQQRNYSVTYRLKEIYNGLVTRTEHGVLDLAELEIFQDFHMDSEYVVGGEKKCFPFPIEILMKAKEEFLSTKNEQQILQEGINESGPSSDFVKKLIEDNMKKNTNLMKLRTENLLNKINKIQNKHCRIKDFLWQFKRMSNESTSSQSDSQSNTTLDFDTSRIDPNKGLSPPPQMNMITPDKNIVFLKELIDSVDDGTQSTLLSFQQFVIDLFNNAEEYKNTTPITQDEQDNDISNLNNTSDKSVEETIQAILNWRVGETFTKGNNITYARPSTVHDNETKVDQPILQAVICRIIEILCQKADNGEGAGVLYKHEYGVTTERTILSHLDDATPSEGDNLNCKPSHRRVDITAQKPEEFTKVMPPIMLQTAIEIKVARNDRNKFLKALEKGKSQIIGHLSKQLEHDFEFGGIGRNASAIGVSLTHLSIEAIEMRLSGVGTEKVDIETVSTGCIPFLGVDFLTVHHAGVDRETETNGFILLAGVLMHKLRTQDKDQFANQIVSQVETTETWDCGMAYLGSGAFSNVYKVGKGMFLKISRAACLEKSLEEELCILKALEDGNEHGIPRSPQGIQSLVQIQAVGRGEISTMKGLRLNGIIGNPLHEIIRKEWKKFLGKIIGEVYKALQYAHGKSIFHLDVRPGNIIVDTGSSDGNEDVCSVMLSDWGCSILRKRNNKTIKHFRGSTPYAHDDFLGKAKKSFYLKSEVDFASLAYTIDHVEKGKLRWAFEFDRPTNVDEKDKDKRRDFVQEWLGSEKSEFPLPPQIRNDLRKACSIKSRHSRERLKPDRYMP